MSIKKEAIVSEDNARQIMAEGKFDLRGWKYSGQEAHKYTSVLGLLWDKSKKRAKYAKIDAYRIKILYRGTNYEKTYIIGSSQSV